MIQFMRVKSDSLSPEYNPGDFVLVAKIPFLLNRLKPGDVIVFNHPEYALMIKKVAWVDPLQGQVFVIGIHPNSVDSRRFGPVPLASVIGKVIWRVSRPLKESEV